jgi:hypothetical protein
MKKPSQSDGPLSQREVDRREKRVLDHFLTTRPEPHKPIGKTAQAKRRRKEKRER